MLTRREMLQGTLAAAATAGCATSASNAAEDAQTTNVEADSSSYKPRYILGSCMYGTATLADIVPQVAATGATAIDIWPKPHGDQREQLDAMGEQAFADLLKRHRVKLGCLTEYMLGPFGLQAEMQLAKRFDCQTMVTGGSGPKDLSGSALKAAVAKFVEKMRPHLEVAEQTGVTIAIENHANNLIDSPDSMRWLMELCPSRHLAIALAPYHLPQDTKLLSGLIRELGNRIAVFYAWQHGMGCMKKLPKEQELLQMPGRGELDFGPLMEALRDIRYSGWTEIFMHPVPRGIPILETPQEVSAEINRSRTYLADKLPAAFGAN